MRAGRPKDAPALSLFAKTARIVLPESSIWRASLSSSGRWSLPHSRWWHFGYSQFRKPCRRVFWRPHTPDLANGKIMFHAGGCASCHAVPKQEDKTRLGGGLALGSPFGTFYVPNISSDRTDGIGAWTEAQFVTAMVKGTSPTGEHLFPAFPYTSYQRMSLGDIRDLFAYLKTLAGSDRQGPRPCFAVSVQYPAHTRIVEVAVPRRSAFCTGSFSNGAVESRRVPDKRSGTLRGMSLPRNMLGAIKRNQRFTGGPSPDGQGGVPNITQQKLKNWTVKDIADTLTTGMTPDADFVGGSMAEVVRNTVAIERSRSRSDGDLHQGSAASRRLWHPENRGRHFAYSRGYFRRSS